MSYKSPCGSAFFAGVVFVSLAACSSGGSGFAPGANQASLTQSLVFSGQALRGGTSSFSSGLLNSPRIQGRSSQPPLSSGVQRAVGYKSLYSFQGGSDGSFPEWGLTYLSGTYYGVSVTGGGTGCGGSGCGTVFTVTPSGKESVLYRFAGGSDGSAPSSLVNVGGTFYGEAALGGGTGCGGGGCGTIFKITPSGTYATVYAFTGGTDGDQPIGGLFYADKALYGVTAFGGGTACNGSGPTGCGTIFKVTESGKETVLYRFQGGSDGELPTAGLVKLDGALYGDTVVGGGGNGCNNSFGCGTIFKITEKGKYNLLYAFQGGGDGAAPTATLTDVSGVLFGTTAGGGLGNSGFGFGTVFEVTASGAESVVYRFGGGTDGAVPQDSLTDVKGELYGTTVNGGSGTGPCGGLSGTPGCGTIFKISATGSYQSLYSFQGGTDGEYPYAGVTDLDGSLYGTTAAGGGASCGGGGCGTVFTLKL